MRKNPYGLTISAPTVHVRGGSRVHARMPGGSIATLCGSEAPGSKVLPSKSRRVDCYRCCRILKLESGGLARAALQSRTRTELHQRRPIPGGRLGFVGKFTGKSRFKASRKNPGSYATIRLYRKRGSTWDWVCDTRSYRSPADAMRAYKSELGGQWKALRGNPGKRRKNSGKHNQPGYQFYVVVFDARRTEKIESGWEYKEDAKEHVKEIRDAIKGGPHVDSYYFAGQPAVISLRGLSLRGLDPDKNSDWLTTPIFR